MNWKNRKEFEVDMGQRFPLFYRDLHGPMDKTCMHWGIAVGRGWWPVIAEMSEKIERLNQALDPPVTAAQIKEKFANLTVYLNKVTDEARQIVREASCECEGICESCGTKEDVEVRGKYYILTLCKKCFEDRELRRNNIRGD